MHLRISKYAALVAVTMSQLACYNTYVIDTSELRKLESQVEPQEVVQVYADCPGGAASAYRSLSLDGTQWAQAEGAAAEGETATDGSDAPAAPNNGCVVVPVSTANAVKVLTSDGATHRVTPFNFVMSDAQIVSPEYDLLLNMSEVRGAEVKQFSGWKTAATMVGVSAVAIGTFVGIALLAPESDGFGGQ